MTADGPVSQFTESVESTDDRDDRIGEAIGKATRRAALDKSSLIESLIRRHTPTDDVISVIDGENVFTFRALTDRKELNDIANEAARFAARRRSKEDGDWYDTDGDTIVRAFILASVSVEPSFTPDELLQIAKQAALAFDYLFASWTIQLEQLTQLDDAAKLKVAISRIRANAAWRARLTVARDAFHSHPEAMATGSYEDFMLLDMVALRMIEREEEAKA